MDATASSPMVTMADKGLTAGVYHCAYVRFEVREYERMIIIVDVSGMSGTSDREQFTIW